MTGAPGINQKDENSALRFVDTHCHLDDDAFSFDIDTVIAQSIAGGVTGFVNVGFEPARWQSAIDLADRFANVKIALGMHPQSAALWSPDTASELVRLIRRCPPRAIGEIGIDLFRGELNLAQQQIAFNDQLDLALEYNLPVIIHMRSAQNEVLDVLRGRSMTPRLLFHSFDGTSELTNYINDNDCIVGVGGLATRLKSGTIREQLERISLSRMVLETDAPYLVPARIKGSRNSPQNIPSIAAFLANLKNIDLDNVAKTTTATAERFFGRFGST